MKVIVILPHPNRHYYDPFKTLSEKGHIDTRYVFLGSQPHYRKDVDWRVPSNKVYNGRNIFRIFGMIAKSDTVVFGGIASPLITMQILFFLSRLLLKKIIVATEEVSFKKIDNKFIKKLISIFFDSKYVICFAIGNRVKATYSNVGISKWTFLRFGCFENRNTLDKLVGKEGKVRLLSVGSLVENKNHILIIEAMKKYSGDKEVELNIAGDGPLKEYITKQSESLPLNVKVIMHGFCNEAELDKLYSISDIFIHPSIRDRWGATVSQAVDASLPLLISDTVGSGEGFLLRKGFNGFDFSNKEEFSRWLYELIDNDELRSTISKNANEMSKLWGHHAVCDALKNYLKFGAINCSTLPLSKI
ncbi:glycosyltransferase [Vibrio parahaemolyticus]|nr:MULTISPECIES: glycosyltransferase [Vibrio]ELB2920773.1 glycosyltransferase family 4 protein [Vibrio alginolyticus]MCZ0741659.1 glycosyltransferase [Vibrio diabolicus]MDG2636736.1 glycosyltransferase [Vibrio parahaemolyticus]MDW1499896.1 glycosyltransferase [Vibrio sp. YT-19(2023)]TOD51953.1 hypothetical protein CGJ63_13795 [Vibrio parahaemolyticus]